VNETAESLHISRETVRSHIKHMLTKLGARNRAHAVTRAYQLGLLEPAREEHHP